MSSPHCRWETPDGRLMRTVFRLNADALEALHLCNTHQPTLREDPMPSRTRPRGRQAWANATHHVKLVRENVTNQLASFRIHLLLFAKHQCLADVLASNRLRLGWQPIVVGVNAAVDEFVQARFWNRFWPLEGMGRLKEANNEKPRPVLRQSMVFAVEDLVARLVSQSFKAADDVVEGRFVKSQQTHYIFKQNYPRKMMSNVRQTVVHDFASCRPSLRPAWLKL